MDKRPFAAKLVLVCILAAMFSSAQAAEFGVLSGNGPKAAVRELCAQFEKATGNKIELRFGVNPEVKQKIEAGEIVVATRIVDVPGVDMVGPIPVELQTHIGFAAGLSAKAKELDAGKALIAFLSAPAAATLKAKGVEPHQ